MGQCWVIALCPDRGGGGFDGWSELPEDLETI